MFTCNLKKYRLLNNMTQEELAEKVGVRRETILRLEAGKYNPSLKLASLSLNLLTYLDSSRVQRSATLPDSFNGLAIYNCVCCNRCK